MRTHARGPRPMTTLFVVAGILTVTVAVLAALVADRR
jgi:hypothetical protein